MKFPSCIEDLSDILNRLPGIGAKSALRLALHMTNWDVGEIEKLKESLSALSEMKTCDLCGVFSDDLRCTICCSDERASSKQICVVENAMDLMAIEKSERYDGQFHVLGGVLNPLMGVGPSQLNIKKLLERVNEGKITNVILALNPSVEGDATCSYLSEVFPQHVQVDRIGFGIPMGGSLEHLDHLTISKALENRQRI